MAFFGPCVRKLVFIRDHRAGKSSLMAVCVADKPSLDKRPPYLGRTSFERLVTGLEWERVPNFLKHADNAEKEGP